MEKPVTLTCYKLCFASSGKGTICMAFGLASEIGARRVAYLAKSRNVR